MIDIIDRYALYKDGIVLVVATFNVDAAAILAVGLYARKHLRIVHRVGIAEYLWQKAHAAHVPKSDAVCLCFDRKPVSIPLNGDAVKRKTPCSFIVLRNGR